MRVSTPICYCLSTLACATFVAASTHESQAVSDDAQPLVDEYDQNNLELRAVVAAADVTTAVRQAPAVTTLWMQSQVNPSSVTYVEVIYTQSFAKIPDQFPSPGVGEIGYGTLQKEKRDAAPTAAPLAGMGDDASSFVLELQTLIHTVGVTPVYQVTELTEVEVDENGSGIGVSNGTVLGNATLPAEMSPEHSP